MILTSDIFLVTGGAGFLGSHIVDYLRDCGAEVWIPRSRWCDLTDYNKAVELLERLRPGYVIHCAGHNGGIEFNRKFPADILYQNSMMALNIHKAAAKSGVKKMISIITSCAYPDNGLEEIPESCLWDGLPNESIRGHGIAKRMLQVCAEQYHNQHGLNAVTVALTNLYGPRDTFNLVRTKVVGAVIRKVTEGKMYNRPSIDFWGTGAPRREFMYVKDAANAVVQALFQYEDHTQPLNIGIGSDMSILDLVNTVVEHIGFEKEIKWLAHKGDGQMKKLLQTDRMRELLDVELTPFDVGLKATVNWYKENKDKADKL